MESIIWFGLIVVLLIAEILIAGFSTIWFAGGALASFFLSLFQVPVFMQIIFFLQISFILLYATRPMVKKIQSKPYVRTNYEAIIGQFGKVISEINNDTQTGLVNVAGQEWSARSIEENIIEEGSKVIVEKIVGVKLIVRVVEENKNAETEI